MENKSVYRDHPFKQTLDKLEDTRNQRLVLYPLQEVLFLVLIGNLSSCDELTSIEAFGEEKLEWLRKYYPYKKGIPSHDTLSRVLGMLNKKKFEELFVSWVASHFKISEDLINLDGKHLSSSANRLDQSKKKEAGGNYAEMIVNVYAQGAGIVLAQNNVTDKMDELSGALQVLEWLNLEGCCITGDSNFCRTKIIKKILVNKANYILALKKNNPTVYEMGEQAFKDNNTEQSVFKTKETGHGREEERTYTSIKSIGLPKLIKNQFPNIEQIIKVDRKRKVTRKNSESIETHYYITDLIAPVEELADKIRKHWSIENQLHYVLDVSFREDQSRVRINNAAANFSVIRKMSFNIIKASPEKGSVKNKRLRFALSDSKRESILENFMMR